MVLLAWECVYSAATPSALSNLTLIERPECLIISNQTEFQQVLASPTPLRTLTCGVEVATTGWAIVEMTAGMDPGGYSAAVNWCTALQGLFNNTGGWWVVRSSAFNRLLRVHGLPQQGSAAAITAVLWHRSLALAGNADCSPGRGGPTCKPCPSGSVSPGGPNSACTPCPAGSFLTAKQDRCYSEWLAACFAGHRMGCRQCASTGGRVRTRAARIAMILLS
jgi:hypothetical protein